MNQIRQRSGTHATLLAALLLTCGVGAFVAQTTPAYGEDSSDISILVIDAAIRSEVGGEQLAEYLTQAFASGSKAIQGSTVVQARNLGEGSEPTTSDLDSELTPEEKRAIGLGYDLVLFPVLESMVLEENVPEIDEEGNSVTTVEIKARLRLHAAAGETGETLFDGVEEGSHVFTPRQQIEENTQIEHTEFGKLFRPLVTDLIKDLASGTELRWNPSGKQIEGKIVQLKEGGEVLYVRLGSKVGLLEGDMLDVYRVLKIIDPETKETLGYDRELIGEVRVLEILDKELCIVRVTKGIGLTVGDVARIRNQLPSTDQ